MSGIIMFTFACTVLARAS